MDVKTDFGGLLFWGEEDNIYFEKLHGSLVMVR
jgi:hypothetical protein